MGVYQLGTPIEITETFTLEGVPTDPTVVTFTVLSPDGFATDYISGTNPEVVNPSVGVWMLQLAAPAFPDTYLYQAFGTGDLDATSFYGEFTVIQSPVAPAPVTWARQGPCLPWCDAGDVWERCGRPMLEVGDGSMSIEVPVDMSAYAEMGSYMMYMLSGRLFAGICEKTVRPCSDRPCGFQVLSGGYVVWPTYDGLPSWGWDGYGWRYPDFTGCGCIPIDRIDLSGYPVREILEVKIDGVAVPETNNWRLDKRRFLTRMADADGNAQVWPACQRVDMPDTEVGTFSVTYLYGQQPPLLGQLAATAVACELHKENLEDEECLLPAGTSRLIRQGVTIEKMATLGWYYLSGTGWQTGIAAVDAFLNTANPNGLTRRPMMMAPGNRRGRFAQPVGQ